MQQLILQKYRRLRTSKHIIGELLSEQLKKPSGKVYRTHDIDMNWFLTGLVVLQVDTILTSMKQLIPWIGGSCLRLSWAHLESSISNTSQAIFCSLKILTLDRIRKFAGRHGKKQLDPRNWSSLITVFLSKTLWVESKAVDFLGLTKQPTLQVDMLRQGMKHTGFAKTVAAAELRTANSGREMAWLFNQILIRAGGHGYVRHEGAGSAEAVAAPSSAQPSDKRPAGDSGAAAVPRRVQLLRHAIWVER